MYGKNVYAVLCDVIQFLYAGALCHGLYHFMLYVFGKCFMPGSVRDGLTRKRKRKERRNHEDLCKAVKSGIKRGGDRRRANKTEKRGDRRRAA